MKKNKKILVLADLENALASTLKSTVGFAKIIGADIEFFYVKKPTDVVGRESQLSAMRSINEEYVSTDKKLQKLADDISEANQVNVKYSYAIGNVKNEIDNRIKNAKPDMVVIGKRKPKIVNFIGDNLTDFILKNYDGSVVIAANKNGVETDRDINLGVFNSSSDYNHLMYMDELLCCANRPVTSFKVHALGGKSSSEVEGEKSNQTIKFTFENNDKIFENLKNYLNKSKVNLLCIDRTESNQTNAKIISLLDKIDVSLMVTCCK